MMTNDELKAIEKRASAATVGPWVNAGGAPNEPAAVDYEGPCYTSSICDVFTGSIGRVAMAIRGDAQSEGQHAVNASFIAAARTDVPALCAAIRERDARILRHEVAMRAVLAIIGDGATVSGVAVMNAIEAALAAMVPA